MNVGNDAANSGYNFNIASDSAVFKASLLT